jgi:hypothetical protein
MGQWVTNIVCNSLTFERDISIFVENVESNINPSLFIDVSSVVEPESYVALGFWHIKSRKNTDYEWSKTCRLKGNRNLNKLFKNYLIKF